MWIKKISFIFNFVNRKFSKIFLIRFEIKILAPSNESTRQSTHRFLVNLRYLSVSAKQNSDHNLWILRFRRAHSYPPTTRILILNRCKKATKGEGGHLFSNVVDRTIACVRKISQSAEFPILRRDCNCCVTTIILHRGSMDRYFFFFFNNWRLFLFSLLSKRRSCSVQESIYWNSMIWLDFVFHRNVKRWVFTEKERFLRGNIWWNTVLRKIVSILHCWHNGNDKAIKWWYHNRELVSRKVPANVWNVPDVLRRLDHFNFTLAWRIPDCIVWKILISRPTLTTFSTISIAFHSNYRKIILIRTILLGLINFLRQLLSRSFARSLGKLGEMIEKKETLCKISVVNNFFHYLPYF